MPILFSFKQLVERDCYQVNACWKFSIILTCLFVLVTGMASTFSQGYLSNSFGGRCVLFANLTFVPPNYTQGGGGGQSVRLYVSIEASAIATARSRFMREIFDFLEHWKADFVKLNMSLARAYDKFKLRGGDKVIDKRNSDWGEELKCHICQYVPTLSTVQGVIWAVLFTMCNRGGKSVTGLGQPARIVIPSMIFFISMTVISIVASSELTFGLHHFCYQFKDITHTEKCTKEINKYTLLFTEKEAPAFAYVTMSMCFSWLSAGGWGVCVIIMTLRILFLIDFDIMTVTVLAKRTRPRRMPEFYEEEEEEHDEVEIPDIVEEEVKPFAKIVSSLEKSFIKPTRAIEQKILERRKQNTQEPVPEKEEKDVNIDDPEWKKDMFQPRRAYKPDAKAKTSPLSLDGTSLNIYSPTRSRQSSLRVKSPDEKPSIDFVPMKVTPDLPSPTAQKSNKDIVVPGASKQESIHEVPQNPVQSSMLKSPSRNILEGTGVTENIPKRRSIRYVDSTSSTSSSDADDPDFYKRRRNEIKRKRKEEKPG